MNNNQYPVSPPAGSDGGGDDDGSGFSPSRLNHPYQQQHPRQSSYGHEDHRNSSRNDAHHVHAGGNRADYYSSYDGHFNQPYYYYYNNDDNNNNNRMGPPPPPPPLPHEVAVGASYYQQQQFIQPQLENTKTEELLKKRLLQYEERQKQHETDMKNMETKQKKMLENVETMQTMMLQQRQSSVPDRRVAGAAVRQLNAIKLEPKEEDDGIIVINDDDDDEIGIKKENDDETTGAELQEHTSEMDMGMGMQTVTPASSASPPSTMQATSSNGRTVTATLRYTDSNGEETMAALFGGNKDNGIGGSGSDSNKTSEDNNNNNNKKKRPPVHAVTAASKTSKTSNPSSSTHQRQTINEIETVLPKELQDFNKMPPNNNRAEEFAIVGNGERRKRKVPQLFVPETSQAHNSRINNSPIQIQNNNQERRTQALMSIRRQTVRSNTETNSSKRSKITIGSQKVHGSTMMEPKSVIKFAVKHRDDGKIQRIACERLRTILTSIDKDNMTSIDEDNARNVTSIDGVQMICNAMKKHHRHSMVISEGCLTLTHFIKYDPDISSKIADEGTIDLIIAAISRWGKSSSKERFSDIKVLEM